MNIIDYWRQEWSKMGDMSAVISMSAIKGDQAKSEVVAGRFYNMDGYYLGDAEKWAGEKVYIVDSAEMDERGHVVRAKNIRDLGEKYIEFKNMAATVYGESSAVYMNKMTEDLRREMFAIAEVHIYNKIAFGSSSIKAKEYKRLPPSQVNKSVFKRTATAAMITALVAEGSFSNGAKYWDGAEQALFDTDETHVMLGKQRIELHMNTRGWRISDEHYAKWKENVGSGFKAPQEKKSKNGTIDFVSAAVYCRTIFWKEQDQDKKK